MGGGTGETGFTEKSSYLTTYAVTGIHEALRSRSFPRTHLYHLLLFLFCFFMVVVCLCHSAITIIFQLQPQALCKKLVQPVSSSLSSVLSVQPNRPTWTVIHNHQSRSTGTKVGFKDFFSPQITKADFHPCRSFQFYWSWFLR